MPQQGCRAAQRSWHFALLTLYAYCSFFTFLLPLQLILKCSSAVITCCAPTHLHQLLSLAVASNQHRINCKFAGRKVSLIKHISKGTTVFMLLSANVSCGDQESHDGMERGDGSAGSQGTGSKGTPQAAPWVRAGRGRGVGPAPAPAPAPAAPGSPQPLHVPIPTGPALRCGSPGTVPGARHHREGNHGAGLSGNGIPGAGGVFSVENQFYI